MTETQDILYNVTGQSLFFDAPEGRPSSVTSVTVYENADDDDAAAESAAGTPAVETNPATTFDAASGLGQADPTKCNLTATTGIVVGRKYLATTAAGEKEWVEPKLIVSADYVMLREPLQNAYAAADTFVSTRISATVDSTWVADKNNISNWTNPNPRYRARWVYVVGGVTYVHATYFDLVRYKGEYSVTGLDVDRAFPGWFEALPTNYREDQGATLIAEAYRQVKMDLYRHEKADQLMRNGEVVDSLVILKANALGAVAGVMMRGGDTTSADYARKLYQDELQNLVAFPKVSMDLSGQGGASKPAPLPIWRR